jgi:3-hydroxyisobutyrate dehydrogenase-like beta-hydroxyacid dehydrogenase
VASPAQRIGFIGVGLMGHGMAKNLLQKGFAVTVVGHRNRKPVDDLVAQGAAEAKSPAEVARQSDIVWICVSTSPQVETIVREVLSAAPKGLIIVDSSTSEPDSTLKLAEECRAKGVTLVDAPLNRTPKEAEEGRLNVMVGADPTSFLAIKPALQAIAENIFHVGPVGAGHKIKLLNNFLAMGQAAAIAEALVAGRKLGVDLDQFCKMITAGGVNSGIFQMMVPKSLTGDFTGFQFGIANALKDLRYYTHMTENSGLPSLIGEAVHQSFVQAAALGFKDRLIASLIEAQAKINNLQFATPVQVGGQAA